MTTTTIRATIRANVSDAQHCIGTCGRCRTIRRAHSTTGGSKTGRGEIPGPFRFARGSARASDDGMPVRFFVCIPFRAVPSRITFHGNIFRETISRKLFP